MIQDDNEYTFTIDNEQIRNLVPFDLTNEECGVIANEIDCRFEQFVQKLARKYRIDHPAIKNDCKVIATLHRQEWEDVTDYCVEVGTTEYKCQDALDSYPLSQLPPCADDIHWKDYLNCGDDLFFTSVMMGLVDDWDGPFDLYVDDEQYERYLDDRVFREYGYEPRKED